MKGRELFLESNSALTPALRLYAANGFVHAPRPDGSSHYKRSDVYMVYRPADYPADPRHTRLCTRLRVSASFRTDFPGAR